LGGKEKPKRPSYNKANDLQLLQRLAAVQLFLQSYNIVNDY
jgi:hypothetical protein